MDDNSDSGPQVRPKGRGKGVLILLVFWIMGCAGLLAFRVPVEGGEPGEDGIPSATAVAILLYTALVVVVALLPRRR